MSDECGPHGIVACDLCAINRAATRAKAAREELEFIISYLAHNDQDANHAWMVRRIRAVLAGKDPREVPGWQPTDGVRQPRRVDPSKGVTVDKCSLGYRLAIPHAWGSYITITDDEADKLAVGLSNAGATAYPPMRQLRDIIDDHFGYQPVMSDDEALSFLSQKLFESRRGS